jgi:hypothetical protein
LFGTSPRLLIFCPFLLCRNDARNAMSAKTTATRKNQESFDWDEERENIHPQQMAKAKNSHPTLMQKISVLGCFHYFAFLRINLLSKSLKTFALVK